MTPAGTSNELDVQNGWEENTQHNTTPWSAEQGKGIFPCPRSRLRIWSRERDGFSSPVPRQPAHLHTQAESDAYLRDSSRVPRRRPFIYLKPPYAIGSVPCLSGHAIAYRWRSLPIVRRHRASKPQGSSERVLSWQLTMDQLIFASLSHIHYWYAVGMLKVPAYHTSLLKVLTKQKYTYAYDVCHVCPRQLNY